MSLIDDLTTEHVPDSDANNILSDSDWKDFLSDAGRIPEQEPPMKKENPDRVSSGKAVRDVNKEYYSRKILNEAKTHLVHDPDSEMRGIPVSNGKQVEYMRYEAFTPDLNDSKTTLTVNELRARITEMVKPFIGEVVTQGFVNTANYTIMRLVELLQQYQNAPGTTSDGYHTFNELYRHRGILFALICADHQEIAWKSLKHHDGTMYPGMFLCGIDTPYGQATYHMDIEPFWNLIKARELPTAPEWDGHTPDVALNRIAAMAMDRFIPLEGGVVPD